MKARFVNESLNEKQRYLDLSSQIEEIESLIEALNFPKHSYYIEQGGFNNIKIYLNNKNSKLTDKPRVAILDIIKLENSLRRMRGTYKFTMSDQYNEGDSTVIELEFY